MGSEHYPDSEYISLDPERRGIVHSNIRPDSGVNYAGVRVEADIQRAQKPVEAYTMQQANDKQVGGQHYKSKMQHWDYVLANNIPYLEAQIIKYLTRWRRKGGSVDLQKAKHFLEKLFETEGIPWVTSTEGLVGGAATGPSQGDGRAMASGQANQQRSWEDGRGNDIRETLT